MTDGDVLQGVRYQRRAARDDRVARHALALGHGAPRRTRRHDRAKLRALTGGATAERRRPRALGGCRPVARAAGSGTSSIAAKRPTRDSARSQPGQRAQEARA